MREFDSVGARLSNARERIGRAARRAGRDPAEVEILAVTKFHPVQAAEAAYGAGIRIFGENRVQEALEKYPAFLEGRPGAEVHMLGHLQGNKVRKAAGLFRCVQSVDSMELMRDLDRRAATLGLVLDVLLELHTGEESKSGFLDRSAVLEACGLVPVLGSLRLRGLMTMAPYTDDERLIRASFRTLRSIFDQIASSRAFLDFDILSMGMSNDFEIAVEEGATLLRLGTALFGPRQPS